MPAKPHILFVCGRNQWRSPTAARTYANDQLIVDHVSKDDIVVTADIPLASLCVKSGARVLSPSGQPFSDANVGDALATRDLMRDLRAEGLITGGPRPFQARDRSRFLERLDQLIGQIKRSHQRMAGDPAG